MDKKTFKSRLFSKIINPDNPDYWIILYAEILHRLRLLEDQFCDCHFCKDEAAHLNQIIKQMGKDGHITPNPRPRNFANKGYCKKSLEESSAKLYPTTKVDLIIPGKKQQTAYR